MIRQTVLQSLSRAGWLICQLLDADTLLFKLIKYIGDYAGLRVTKTTWIVLPFSTTCALTIPDWMSICLIASAWLTCWVWLGLMLPAWLRAKTHLPWCHHVFLCLVGFAMQRRTTDTDHKKAKITNISAQSDHDVINFWKASPKGVVSFAGIGSVGVRFHKFISVVGLVCQFNIYHGKALPAEVSALALETTWRYSKTIAVGIAASTDLVLLLSFVLPCH